METVPIIVAFLLATLLLLFAITYAFPARILRAVSHLFPDVVFYVPPSKASPKVVALSIDDTCDPTITLQALAVLNRYKARATFFVIGSYVEKADLQSGGLGQHILEELVESGHELGNHTWFDRATVSLKLPDVQDELQRVQHLIDTAHKTTGVPAPKHRWFRPGHGWFSRDLLDLSRSMGYNTALGDVFPYDPQV